MVAIPADQSRKLAKGPARRPRCARFAVLLSVVLATVVLGSKLSPMGLSGMYTWSPTSLTALGRGLVGLDGDYSSLSGFNAPIDESHPQAAALAELAACTTLDCLTRMHPQLAHLPFNLPHFMLVGWQKCATTSIYRHLARHPQVLKPFLKEPHFFSSCQFGGKACRVQGGNNERAYIRDTFQVHRAAASGLTMATLEASVDYAQYGEEMAARLHGLFPWLKVVFVVRERIGRGMSWKNMMQQKFGKGCTNALDTCLYNFVGRSNYTSPLEAWLRHFPREQVHLIQLEQLGKDTEGVMRRLKEFLGLDPDLPQMDLRNVNARSGSSGWPMEKDKYQKIVDLAREDADLLLELIEKHELGDRRQWAANWEEVWKRNLDSCDSAGDCRISSS